MLRNKDKKLIKQLHGYSTDLTLKSLTISSVTNDLTNACTDLLAKIDIPNEEIITRIDKIERHLDYTARLAASVQVEAARDIQQIHKIRWILTHLKTRKTYREKQEAENE